MPSPAATDAILWDRDFKVLCDGLLRFELGHLVQTFASDGVDGGVDAEFDGDIDGVKGRWVFQYKFRSPKEALSRRRAWLAERYFGAAGRKSEFDKAGVKDADGYVLMTNVPVTSSMMRKLRTAWRQRGHAGPVCVWDPSRLDALLRGREHLARSWSGAKEARCHQAIVLPLWQWLESAMTASGNWLYDPLWPLEVRAHRRVIPIRSFHQNFEARDGWILAPRADALDTIASDPQFHYAATIVYPVAMQSFERTRRAVGVLATAVLGHVDALSSELVDRLPQLQQLRSDERLAATRILAYCVLESRWGFPMRGLHSIRDGRLVAQGKYYVWDQPALTDIEPVLDELVGEVEHGAVSEHVVAARIDVDTLVREWWERMWHVVSFGVDAENVHPRAP